MDSKQPSNIVTFKYYSDIDKQDYSGVFKVKRISVFGVNEIQVTGNELTKGYGTATPAHAILVQRMATIDHVIDSVLEGATWFQKGNPKATWENCHDTTVTELLYKEVVKYDDWFRRGTISSDSKKENEKTSDREPEKPADSVDSVGREESKPKQEESGVSEVIIG